VALKVTFVCDNCRAEEKVQLHPHDVVQDGRQYRIVILPVDGFCRLCRTTLRLAQDRPHLEGLVKDLNLSERVKNALISGLLKELAPKQLAGEDWKKYFLDHPTIGELSRFRERDLLTMRGIGPKSIRELREALASLELTLSP
jgi:hypothetical protein